MPAAHWPERYNRVTLDQRWMIRGACLRRTDLPWIIERPLASERREMAAVCGACPVLNDCGLFAVGARVTAGFFAGAPRGEQLPASGTGAQDQPTRRRPGGLGGAA